ncbi:MAG TPA: adenylate/guanylate cyclase domain-containing protein [Acidimicrobiales bacterium]
MAHSGVDADLVLRIVRAAGFPAPGPDDRVMSPDLVHLCRVVQPAVDIFGEDAIFQLLRVMGSTTARLADALVSSLLANVEPLERNEDPVGLEVAKANSLAASLFPQVVSGLDAILRQHLVALRRTAAPDSEDGVETRALGVGFVDLVDSTGLALAVPMGELGMLLTEFENLDSDAVVAAGGRVVKLIGDEVLYTAPDPVTACAIALDLAELMRSHARLPEVRAGVAFGEVMLRDGDVFGPMVNLAARAAKVGGPGDVVVDSAMADAAGMPSEPLGILDVRGFGSVGLSRLTGRPPSSTG